MDDATAQQGHGRGGGYVRFGVFAEWSGREDEANQCVGLETSVRQSDLPGPLPWSNDDHDRVGSLIEEDAVRCGPMPELQPYWIDLPQAAFQVQQQPIIRNDYDPVTGRRTRNGSVLGRIQSALTLTTEESADMWGRFWGTE